MSRMYFNELKYNYLNAEGSPRVKALDTNIVTTTMEMIMSKVSRARRGHINLKSIITTSLIDSGPSNIAAHK